MPGPFIAARSATASFLPWLLGLTLSIHPSLLSAADAFKVVEVPFSVTRRSVAFKTLLSVPVHSIVTGADFAAFVSDRKVWIKKKGQGLVLLSDLVALPQGFDWFQSPCLAGDRLVIGVSNYSEKQRQKDMATPRGGYVEGPRGAGILVVEGNLKKATLISEFKIVKKPPAPADTPEMFQSSNTLKPQIQSCFWKGVSLYVGGYGHLAKLNLIQRTAEVLEFDLELAVNRTSLWIEGDVIWYTADEGGLSGTWIQRIEGGKSASYRLLNYHLTVPDVILRHDRRLLTSSLAGVVEIDEKRKIFTHYKLTEDKTRMRVYKLSVIEGGLWGVREDGWVKFDLPKKSALHFQLQGNHVSNNIYSIGYFEGRWLIASEKELVHLE